MTTPARELRDALAEALWRSSFIARERHSLWRHEPTQKRESWLREADRLLASLPSVKLKMGWEE